MIRLRAVVLVQAIAAAALASEAEEPLVPAPPDLEEGTPKEFPRFFLAGHDEAAQVLGRYLWHHFRTRGGEGPVLFNKEYNTTADLWMGGALHPGWDAPIQAIHRRNLLAAHIDREGYVACHQHFSHAHDWGWPFPFWCFTPPAPQGLAVGWHFENDGPGWVWEHVLRRYPDTPNARAKAIEGWELKDLENRGIADGVWRLVATGPAPALTTPAYAVIDAGHAPFVQLRWRRSGDKTVEGAFLEWMREGDAGFADDRRVPFDPDSGNPDYERTSHTKHRMAALWRHPLWKGKIVRMRIVLPAAEAGETIDVDSFFTAYDTRHTINNPILILASWTQYRWTGDAEFLKEALPRMRKALRFHQTELNGLALNRIRAPWSGHSGRSGFTVLPDGTRRHDARHGVGQNYWDILPFGGDDLYATNQYHAATLAMAEAEAAAKAMNLGAPDAFDPAALRAHAAAVKAEANRLFWDAARGRYVACIDDTGAAHDYGFTFLNLDAIWYGIATEERARAILDWLSGKRIVEGDTSTGADIYHWRFGPRATTKRNVEWYHFAWDPNAFPWGAQVQDGGAVLGFSFYDLWARLKTLGPDDAWRRLQEIVAWEKEVRAEGGYRKYYEGGKRGATLQGGGTAGGIGIDAEFYESSLVPSILIHGFLGLAPTADVLTVRPQLPAACPEMGVANLLYRGTLLDVRAGPGSVAVEAKTAPAAPIRLDLGEGWTCRETGAKGPVFMIDAAGRRTFVR